MGNLLLKIEPTGQRGTTKLFARWLQHCQAVAARQRRLDQLRYPTTAVCAADLQRCTVCSHWRKHTVSLPSGRYLVFTIHHCAICCRRVSVRLSVCLSQVDVLLKRLNVGSRKQRHTIAQRLKFSDAKDFGEIRTNRFKCRWVG